jgi:hypothetical protein
MSLYRIRTRVTGPSGGPWLSTFYFDSSGGTAGQAAAAVELFWFAVKALMVNTVTATNDGVAVTINEVTGEPTAAIAYAATAQVGALATEELPRAAQGLIRWQTGVYLGGRERRGRTFIPGLGEGANTAGGVVAAATITSLNTAAANLIGDANSILAVWSRAHGAFSPVVAGTTWNEFAVLRSRRD